MRMGVMYTLSAALLIGAFSPGCGRRQSPAELISPTRYCNGMVVILPGIEGAGLLSAAVQRGLNAAGINHALPVYRWGRPIPVAGPLINQMDCGRARRIAGELAVAIQTYQKNYPNRPVHLVGHSGGAAVVVFTLEQLPSNARIDGAVLLSPSLSAEYDLTKALARTRKGIAHFWSRGDVALLVVGTSVFGNLDGVHGPAAGARGFTNVGGPSSLFDKLHQTRWRPAMAQAGNRGGHLGTVSSEFVSEWVSRWITASTWPPPVATLASARAWNASPNRIQPDAPTR